MRYCNTQTKKSADQWTYTHTPQFPNQTRMQIKNKNILVPSMDNSEICISHSTYMKIINQLLIIDQQTRHAEYAYNTISVGIKLSKLTLEMRL